MSNTLGNNSIRTQIKALAISTVLLLTGCSSYKNETSAPVDISTTTIQIDAHVSDEAPNTPPSVDQHTTQAPATSQYPTLEQIRGDKELPDNLAELLADQVVHVEIDGGQCTGMIINGYLVSAAHCALDKETGKGTSHINYSFSQENFEQVRGSASSWTYNNSNLDVLVAKLDPSSDFSHGWNVPYFANENPEVGTPFAIASHALGINPPLEAHITYIGGDADHYVFAVDTNNSPEALNDVCQPGASGSMITDGYGHVSVLSGVYLKYRSDGTINPDYENAMRFTEDNYKVDLTGVNLICYGSPVTRDTINGLINALENPEPEHSILANVDPHETDVVPREIAANHAAHVPLHREPVAIYLER